LLLVSSEWNKLIAPISARWIRPLAESR